MGTILDANTSSPANDPHHPVHPETVTDAHSMPGTAFLPVIADRDGSSTLAWHMVVPPGGTLPPYSLTNCDEIVVVVAGHGVGFQDGEHATLRAGHCWLCPNGAERHFRNESRTEPAVLVGFWPGAADLQAAGYEAVRPSPERGRLSAQGFSHGVLVHPDDVSPEAMDAGEGWSISDFRLPLGRHNGCTTTLFRAQFLPGAVHRKHRHDHCEEIYHVISGRGLAGAGESRSEVRRGHFHYIPAGVEHWLVNRDADEPVEVVGIYVGAGSVEESGYVYAGEVSADDLG